MINDITCKRLITSREHQIIDIHLKAAQNIVVDVDKQGVCPGIFEPKFQNVFL
jgi:hypothetical protein